MASAVKASDYYNNADKHIAVPVLTALLSEDGWLVPAKPKPYLVKTSDEAGMAELGEMELGMHSTLHHSLEGIKVEKIRAGQFYRVGMIPLPAPTDGYLLSVDDGRPGNQKTYFTAAHYQALFGDWTPVEGSKLINASLLPDGLTQEWDKCVILEEDVTFGFADGEYTAKKGMVLYRNEGDKDGYTVLPIHHYLRGRAIWKPKLIEARISLAEVGARLADAKARFSVVKPRFSVVKDI